MQGSTILMEALSWEKIRLTYKQSSLMYIHYPMPHIILKKLLQMPSYMLVKM